MSDGGGQISITSHKHAPRQQLPRDTKYSPFKTSAIVAGDRTLNVTTPNMVMDGIATEGWGGTTLVASTKFQDQQQVG